MKHPTGSCPVCEKPFKTSDDIVICPSCGAPYHRACYEKTGDCLFIDQHSDGFEYKKPPSTTPENAKDAYSQQFAPPSGSGQGIVCKTCQTVNDTRNIFCEKCGAPLHAVSGHSAPKGQPPPPSFFPREQQNASPFAAPTVDMSGEIDGISMKDWAAFIGNSAPSYLLRLTAQQKRGHKFGFMISAFFLGPFYFAYRKMWGWATLTFFISLLLMLPLILLVLTEMGSPLMAGASLQTLESLVSATSYVSMLFDILCGVFALYLFRLSSVKKIKILRQKHSSETDYQSALHKKGGISIPGLLLFLLAEFLIFFVFGLLLGPDLLPFTNLMMQYSGLPYSFTT